MKKCPFCTKEIPDEEKICRFCKGIILLQITPGMLRFIGIIFGIGVLYGGYLIFKGSSPNVRESEWSFFSYLFIGIFIIALSFDLIKIVKSKALGALIVVWVIQMYFDIKHGAIYQIVKDSLWIIFLCYWLYSKQSRRKIKESND